MRIEGSFCRQHLHGIEMHIPARTGGAEDDGGFFTGGEGKDTEGFSALFAFGGFGFVQRALKVAHEGWCISSDPLEVTGSGSKVPSDPLEVIVSWCGAATAPQKVAFGHSSIAARSLEVTCSQCRSTRDPPEATSSESVRAHNRQKARGAERARGAETANRRPSRRGRGV